MMDLIRFKAWDVNDYDTDTVSTRKVWNRKTNFTQKFSLYIVEFEQETQQWCSLNKPFDLINELISY